MIGALIIALGISLMYTAFFSFTLPTWWPNFKPFNCTVCLSFWTVMAILIGRMVCPEIMYFFYPLSVAGIAAYVAMIAKRIMFRV